MGWHILPEEYRGIAHDSAKASGKGGWLASTRVKKKRAVGMSAGAANPTYG
jgi:hypothetical protein